MVTGVGGQPVGIEYDAISLSRWLCDSTAGYDLDLDHDGLELV